MMKTVYSRFGNIKAGKFAANASELSSDDYDEQSYENLNDIETVLNSIGIKIRENATSFREMDDVLEEIGSKWESFNDVTKNAVGTAIAGTRQRENVTALFENWDKVQKYSKIAETSYGTAAQKMEAYNDSLEASQNRVTAAIEKATLAVNGSNVLIKINNMVAMLIENMGTLTLSLLGLGLAFNSSAAFNVGVKGFSALGTKIMEVGSIFSDFKKNVNDASFGENIKKNLDERYAFQQSSRYFNNFSDYASKAGLTGEQSQNLINYQSNMLKVDKGYQSIVSDVLTEKAPYEMLEKALDDNRIAAAMNTLKTTTLSNMRDEEIAASAKHYFETGELTNVTAEQAQAIRQAIVAEKEKIAAIYEDTKSIQGESSATKNVIGKNLGNSSKSGSGSAQVFKGATSLIGMIGGGFGGSGLAEAAGLGSGGQMVGSILGSVGGTAIINNLGKSLNVLGTVAKSGKAAGTAFAASMGTGLVASSGVILGAVALIGGLVYKGYKAYKEKILKEAQEDFQKASEKYTKAFNASGDTTKYAELVKGVDSLGNNVSLTDDEYQEFLDISNELASAFPSLITRTDDAGNSFVGMGGKVSDVTTKVDELTKSMQKQADQTLLNKDLLEKNLKTASKGYKTSEDNKSNVNKHLENISKTGKISNSTLINASDEEKAIFNKYGTEEKVLRANDRSFKIIRNYSEDDIKSIEGELKQLASTYEQEMNEATQSISGEMKAQVRTALGDSFYDLSDEEVQAINSVASSITPDTDGWEDKVSDIAKKTRDFLDKNPVYLDFLYGDNSDMTAEEASKMYQEIASEFAKYFKIDESEAFKILIGLGWDSSGLNIGDALGKIKAEGLTSKLQLNGTSLEAATKDMSAEDAIYGYEILKNTIDGTTLSVEQFQNAIFMKKISDSGISSLATEYERLQKATDKTSIDESYMNRIGNYLKNYATQLHITSGNIDDIVAKAKKMGSLTPAGMSEDSFEDVQNKISDYKELYNYLENDFNGKSWADDKVKILQNYSELMPFINNPAKLKAELKSYLDSGEDEVKNVLQNQIASTEEGSQAMIDNASSMVAAFKEKYGIDLA